MVVYSRQRPALASISRVTLADRVFDAIVEAIVQGRIAPGETINEVNLSTRLGVSRAPLREAIFRLEAKGLVDRVPHLGARVVELQPRDLEELFLIREGLEGMAARLAAVAMSGKDLDALEQSLAAHRHAGARAPSLQGASRHPGRTSASRCRCGGGRHAQAYPPFVVQYRRAA